MTPNKLVGQLRYAGREMRKHFSDPYWWAQRFKSRIVGPVLGYVHGTNEGIDVIGEEWDNLLILDACRADMFEEIIGTEAFDEYRRVTSRGASSPEWMERNFAGGRFGDVVYITANPWISKIAPESFHDIVNIWIQDHQVRREDLEDAHSLGDIDTSLDHSGLPAGVTTIPAAEVNDFAKNAAADYPEKRLIVHYMQPHAPCIGRPDGTLKTAEEYRHDLVPGPPLRQGTVTRDDVWQAYAENLEYVYKHAARLAEALPGHTVFTSDHGELFGDQLWPFPFRGFGHPSGLRHPDLVTVPWAEKAGERKTITDEGTSTEHADREELDERLRDLGYKV